jgi:branched-chain amino acid transport system permease protein
MAKIKAKNRKKSTRTYLICFALVLVFWAVMEIMGNAGMLSSKTQGLLIPICAYAIMAVSLNLVVGFLGELSLGHAAFMLAGATAGVVFYNGAGLNMHQVPRVIITLIIGAAAAGLFGVIVGVPVLRFSGDYLAIVTLAFCQILKNVLSTTYLGVDSKGIHLAFDQGSFRLEPGAKPLIKGAQPISGINKISPNIMISFTVGIVLLLLTVAFVLNLMNSRAGRAITAIRDDEIAAKSIGINLTRYKLMAFISSAVFAGLAGVIYVLNLSTLDFKKYDYNLSINVLVMVVLGGMGNVPGSIIAAALLTFLPELLRDFSQYRMFIYSIVLIVIMLFNQAPAFVQLRQRLLARIRPARSGAEKMQEKADGSYFEKSGKEDE